MDILERHRPLEVDSLTVGPMQTGCYIVSDKATEEMMVIDPGGDSANVIESVRMTGVRPTYIVNTHGHADHIAGNAQLKEHYPEAILCIHPADARMLETPTKNLSAFLGQPVKSPPADRLLEEGDELALGRNRFRVLHLPGHTPGGIGLYWAGTDQVAGMLFSGDALFAGGIGRTDLPGGDERVLLEAIRTRLFSLPDDTLILPGHGPRSTTGREKKTNPFLNAG
jgi:glyoxylase-like metal-dependent hydrolase (beta-lactamase superfamily II)